MSLSRVVSSLTITTLPGEPIELRRQIGIVPQDSLLFEGTVAENIALNDPQASTESILQAAKIACAHDFIMGLGQGYATPLAEREAISAVDSVNELLSREHFGESSIACHG